MSASSKKKLRNAENAEKLTEKQLAEQKEAKKLKIMTAAFVVVIAVMVVFAAWTAISRSIENSGIRERSTVALTVGDHEISNAELNFYFIDSVNQFYRNYGSYASLFGLDLTKALDEQYVDEEGTTTWADDFMTSAIENVKAVYALTDEAAANGYTLSEDEQASIDTAISYMDLYAAYNNYSNTEDYVKALYGKGATLDSLRAYYEKTALAESYQNYYSDSLAYTDAELRAAEAENYNLYSSYSYNTYYLSVSKFYEGGTTDEDGNTTYSDEEKAAGELAAKAAAGELANGEYASTADFDAAIAALSINADSTAASTAIADNAYSSISSLYADWLTDDARVAGDTTYVANVTHSHAEGETHSDDEDTSEYDTVSGYYVIYYVGSNDNTFPLANVRHILVAFEGGTTDDNGNTTYSDDEKAAAKEAAEALYEQWKSGDATEDSFAELANAESDDGDGTTGGLYEDVYPGQMVTNFNDWCFADGRKAGDTGIVETEYGYHVMFYVGDSDTNYRDYLIKEDLVEDATNEWYNALVEALTVTELDTKYISTGLVLSAG